MSPQPSAPALDQRLPRYHRVRGVLSAEIAARRWKPGEAIPSEAEIAEAHQVSVGTVRKAIDSLVAAGVLERFQGKGTFVRRPDFQSKPDQTMHRLSPLYYHSLLAGDAAILKSDFCWHP